MSSSSENAKTLLSVKKAYVDTNQGQLHYRFCGDGGPKIVFLQLLPFGSMMVEDLMRYMAGRGYSCTAFDLMGYGRSDPRTGNWLVHDYADNIKDALDVLGIKSCIAFGGHFAAMVAIDLADRYGALVHKLVLDGVPLNDKATREKQLRDVSEKPPLDNDGDVIKAHWHFALGVITTADPETKIDPITEPAVIEAFQNFLPLLRKPGPGPAYFSYPAVDVIARIKQPTLVVGSSTDTLRQNHDQAVRSLKDGSAHFFDGINPIYQFARGSAASAADEYAQVLDNFLGGPN